MTRLVAAAIVAALAGAAQLAAAIEIPACCACLPSSGWQTSGGNQTAITAAFCAAAPPANPEKLGERCDAEPGHSLSCFPNIPGEPCASELAEAGILCPSAGAPAASSSTLLALAVALGAAGVLASRRLRAR